jgi:hypothetical protein
MDPLKRQRKTLKSLASVAFNPAEVIILLAGITAGCGQPPRILGAPVVLTWASPQSIVWALPGARQ